MRRGPGRYDNICEDARKAARARAAVLLIIEGDQGNGFSMAGQSLDMLMLPGMLHKLADDMAQQQRFEDDD